PDVVDAYTGELRTLPALADLPLPAVATTTPRDDLFVAVPYRQFAERGYPCVDDGAPLLALVIDTHRQVGLADALAALPNDPLTLRDGGFDLGHRAYARIVRHALTHEM